MTSINDYENWATKMANYNSLDLSEEQLDRIRNLDTLESAKLDVLIDLMADMQQSIERTNQKLDVHHTEQIEYQDKTEAWHKADSTVGKTSKKIAIATLVVSIISIIVSVTIAIGTQILAN